MTVAACAVFAVPPFPGASPHEVVQVSTSVADAVGQASPADIIARLRADRVGGAFWNEPDAAPEALINPWSASVAAHRFSADDPNAFLAAIAAHQVEIDGTGPFSALHGLAPGNPEHEETLGALVHCHLLAGRTYHDPFTGSPITPIQLIETLAGWRRLIDANRPIVAAFGFAHWKRDTVDPLLWGGRPVPFRPARESELDDIAHGASIAVWKARVPQAFLDRLETGPWRIVEVEDGFIRSTGLGADCVPPLSIVVDDLGVHYDPQRPNRLEEMLAQDNFSASDLARAQRLREWLVREGISKYGVGGTEPAARGGGARKHILVVGQVEDDRSVQFGGGTVRTNLDLLRRVRTQEPDAWLVYRPHPDVEAGHRRGAIPARTVGELADAIDAASPISALIAMADDIHVITSLAGFEALLQGKTVTTHGTPFFAGWGLTRDLGAPSPRRGRVRSIDELVATVLLKYPRYLDPVTNLPASAEILVMRLLSGVQRQNDALVPLRRLVGWAKRATAQIMGMR